MTSPSLESLSPAPTPQSGYKLGSHRLMLSAHPATRRKQKGSHCKHRAFGFRPPKGQPSLNPKSLHPPASVLPSVTQTPAFQALASGLGGWWEWPSPLTKPAALPSECAPPTAHGLPEATSWQSADRQIDRAWEGLLLPFQC